jgi:hypothetical protein
MGAWIAIAIAIWWTGNTVSHHNIHRPLFRRRSANACANACLTLMMGIPQPLWRDRHLAHHGGVRWRLHLSPELLLHAGIVLASWTALARTASGFFVQAYVPGYLAALALCAVHGHYEHAGGTTSHYGWLYNRVCLNDGYHAEHHRYPGVHWMQLPAYRQTSARASPWPAPVRWMEAVTRSALCALERLVLRSTRLQRFVLRRHATAFEELTSAFHGGERIAIVGGGLFPRTALVLRQLCPSARVTIVDASQANLDRARAFLATDEVAFVWQRFTAGEPAPYDVVVLPLSFDGDRNAIYAYPPAPVVIVHDWLWRRRGVSRVVSLALMKRVNLIRP